jgi:hypothetical protein
MIKLVYCLRRLKTLSLREFQEHWLEAHARFGRQLPGLRRYVHYHVLENDPIREAMAQAGVSKVEPFDGIAIAWWDSMESMQGLLEGNAIVKAALEDEKHFIDHSRSLACVTEEHVVVEPQAHTPIVLIECLQRRADITREKFREHWRHHEHIGRRAHEMGLLMGYIQNDTLLGDAGRVPGLGTGQEPFDGVVTAYFHSVAAFKALVASPLASEESYEDEKKFIDHSRSVDMLTRRHVIRDVER